jgi:LacI family transcriptional regulator
VEYKNWIQQRKLDGIIMLGTYPKSIFEEIKELAIPVVLTDVYEEYASDFHCVRADDEWGGYMATKHLLDLGHVNIAISTGNINASYVNYFRCQGYLRALREANIIPDRNLVFEEHVTFDGGYRVGKNLMASNCKATAVFAVADIMAIGIIKAFFENNKNIPGDMSIIGFDDIQFAKYTTPGLTTMRQNIIMKGKASAEMIINDLKIRKRTQDSVVLRPELVVRESTAHLK